MDFKEAENFIATYNLLKKFEHMPDEIKKLHKDGNHEEVARLAIMMADKLAFIYRGEIDLYPSKIKK